MDRIFNAHTHIFPSKIAEKAVVNIGRFYDLKMNIGGTSEDLLADGAPFGVAGYLVCSVATTAQQVTGINDFIAGECRAHPEFLGFGSLHPDFADPAAETDRIIGLGLRGVKLHSDFQRFDIDDERAFPIYAACEGRLPVLLHMGDDRYDYSDPRRLGRVLDRFPGLTVIAAHLGGYQSWDRIDGLLGRERVWLDTSSALDFMTPERAADIIRRHGAERVLFGTDSPMWDHKSELARFDRLPLTPEERKAILWDNAARLFGL